MTKCRLRLIVTCVLASFAAPAMAQTSRPTTHPATTHPATTRSATRPAAKPPSESKASQEALRAAVAVLSKEAQTATQKNEPFPRTKSDYFKDQSPGIEQDDLLKLLARSIVRDPRADAYIKLQLLSCVTKFDVANAKPALQAYVSAPPLIPMPGLTQRELQQLDRKMQQAKEADVAKINDELDASRKPVDEMNAIIIEYRDALREKISVDDETKPKLLQARVEELSQRAAAGYDTWKPFGTLATDIQTWAALANKKQLGNMVAFLSEYPKRSGPTVYEKLMSGKRGLYWRKREATLDDKRLNTLIDAVKKAEANAL